MRTDTLYLTAWTLCFVAAVQITVTLAAHSWAV